MALFKLYLDIYNIRLHLLLKKLDHFNSILLIHSVRVFRVNGLSSDMFFYSAILCPLSFLFLSYWASFCPVVSLFILLCTKLSFFLFPLIFIPLFSSPLAGRFGPLLLPPQAFQGSCCHLFYSEACCSQQVFFFFIRTVYLHSKINWDLVFLQRIHKRITLQW